MRLRVFDSFEALTPGYAALFERAAEESFCLTRWWFEAFAAGAMAPSERLRLIGLEDGGMDGGGVEGGGGMEGGGPEPLALLVGRHRERDASAGGARTLASLGNYYTLLFAPLLADSRDPRPVLGALFEALRSQVPRYDRLRIEPLARDSPLLGDLEMALGAAGLIVQPYFHFGNRYEDTDALSARDYLARRPSVLRNTLRRKGGKLERRGGARFELIAGGAALGRAMADYERVYAASRKESEPHPGFIRDLVTRAAEAGALRLGFLHLDGQAAAAQIWILWRGRATIYKMAHDARLDPLSLGTLLTWRMMERMIDEERVAQVDFGPGDQPFKRAWMSRRRERWGLVAFDPRTPRGAAGALYHVVGRRVKRWVLGGDRPSRTL